jgi:hypothetical protein
LYAAGFLKFFLFGEGFILSLFRYLPSIKIFSSFGAGNLFLVGDHIVGPQFSKIISSVYSRGTGVIAAVLYSQFVSV